MKHLIWISLAFAVGSSMSCMTTYDANGRPVQSVDPAAAVAGVAAAGLVGYAIGNNNDHHHNNNYYYQRGGYYGNGYHRGHSHYHRGYR
ncbi:MAG: hypothetical protein V4584_07365 [Verrucomicrobiota bacterium]